MADQRYQPTQEEIQAAFRCFDWIAQMRPELDRRKRERENLLRQECRAGSGTVPPPPPPTRQ